MNASLPIVTCGLLGLHGAFLSAALVAQQPVQQPGQEQGQQPGQEQGQQPGQEQGQDPKELDAIRKAEEALIRQIQSARVEVSDVRARLLGNVKVNGIEIPAQVVKREIVYLTAANTLQQKILEFVVEDWKQRFIKEGKRKAGDFKIDSAKLETDLRSGLQEFADKYPTLDFWEVVRAQNGASKEQYLHQLRNIAMFDKVFMDSAPDTWPEITREAVMAGSQGGDPQSFWDSLVKGGRDEKGAPREMPPMWKQMIRTMVIRQMQSWSQTKFAADGVPADTVVEVEGLRWTTEDAFNEVKENVFLQDLERAYTEVVVREALRQELQSKNCYPSDEEFKKAYDAHAKEFEGTLFNLNMIAVAFKGYPTLEAYRQRWRLMHGFEKLIAKDINDENLQAHLTKYNRFFGDGNVNCDVISFMAKDGKTGAWRNDGMNEARMRAEAALKLIQSGKSFDEVLQSHGEFFHQDEVRGRFGDKSLNELRKQLRETEYSDLTTGVSLGNWIYYQAPVGKVSGPKKGVDAYYVVRVNARSPERDNQRLSDERTRDLVKQDYTSQRFMEWANGVLARAKIE